MLLERFGTCEPQPESDWYGSTPLPAEIARFFIEVGPLGALTGNGFTGVEVPVLGSPFWFPPLSQLWDLQAGYRWHALSGEPLEDWSDAWFVVGSQGGDPLVYDATSQSVSLRPHGGGDWSRGAELPGTTEAVVGAIALLGALIEDAQGRAFTIDLAVDADWLRMADEELTSMYGALGAALIDALMR